MDDMQERLEHYEAKDRERKEREAEIMRIDLYLFVYARTHDTINEDYWRTYMQRNALILDYGKTYGTEALERLREMLDEAREKLLARMHEFEKEAGIKKMEKITDDYIKEKERIYDMILEENIILNKFLYDIFSYADRDIRERHGDDEYIAEDLKNMFFKVQREIRKIRAGK